jgi:hypothetical protein
MGVTINDTTARERFNWGFHDAVFHAERGKGRDNTAYAAGYRAGLAAYAVDGRRAETSTAAWQAWITTSPGCQAR